MGRYDTFRYGDGTLYGTTTGSTLLWAIEVDWDNDGVFDGSNEADRCVSYRLERGRRFFLRKDGSGFENMQVGKLTFTLTNEDKRYDAFNTSSDLYPNVAPGRYVRVRVKDWATGATYDRFMGRIDDIQPETRGGLRYVRITALDGWRYLRDNKISVGLQTGITTDAAVTQILSEAEWPSIYGQDIGAGSDTLDYWWEDDVSAATAINRIVERENARFYVAADGTAVFRGRNAIDTSVVTLDESELLKDIRVHQPWETQANVARVVAYPKVRTSSVELWRLQDTPLVGAGESLTLFAQFTYNNDSAIGDNLITPVAVTDYTANTAADGSGTDLTSNFSVSIVSTFGETAKIKVMNNGAVGGYVTLLKIRGDAITSPNSLVLETDNSSATSPPRVLRIDNRLVQSTTQAADYSVYLADYFGKWRGFPIVTVENRWADQFTPDLTERVTLSIPTLGISGDYRVGHIEERWLTPNGQAVQTMFRFEPFQDVSTFWIFDNDLRFDVNTIFGY